MKKTNLGGTEIYSWDVKKYLRLVKMGRVQTVLLIASFVVIVVEFRGWLAAEQAVRTLTHLLK